MIISDGGQVTTKSPPKASSFWVGGVTTLRGIGGSWGLAGWAVDSQGDYDQGVHGPAELRGEVHFSEPEEEDDDDW